MYLDEVTVAIVEGNRIDGEDLLVVAELGHDEQLPVAQLSGDVRRPFVGVGRPPRRRRRRAQVEDEPRGLAGADEEGHVHRVGQRQAFLRRDRHRHQRRRRVLVTERRCRVTCNSIQFNFIQFH